MKEMCAPISQHRDHVLETFGLVTGSIPFDVQAVGKAREKVEKEGGRELLVEACAVAGAFEAITRLVDGTGRQLPLQRESRTKLLIMKVFKNRHTAGMAAAAVAVAFGVVSVMKR